MIRSSETLGQFAAALAAAQATMGHASKDGKNPHFKSSYATLAAVIEAIREPLSKQGIAFTSLPTTDGLTVSVETRLIHKSGEWISATCSAAVRDASPQVVGSAQTYLRRYGLQAICGLAAEDDDGEATRNAKPPPPREKDATWEASRAGFCAELGRLGVDYDRLAEYLESIGRERPSAMDAATRASLIRALKPETAFRAKFDAYATPKEA
jgi:hypothetical protein